MYLAVNHCKLNKKSFPVVLVPYFISSDNNPRSNNHLLKNKRHCNPFLGKWSTHLAGQLFVEQEAAHSILDTQGHDM